MDFLIIVIVRKLLTIKENAMEKILHKIELNVKTFVRELFIAAQGKIIFLFRKFNSLS